MRNSYPNKRIRQGFFGKKNSDMRKAMRPKEMTP
jgi:hypothetical protein